MARVLHTWDDYESMRRTLPLNVIFVFGSNHRGAHGAGAAKFAKQYFGAIYGKGEGFMGQSYAIPTKDHNMKPCQLDDINRAVQRFIDFAINNPRLNFFLTPIGCGRAGYHPSQITPMFHSVPSNCAIPLSWVEYFPGFEFIESGV